MRSPFTGVSRARRRLLLAGAAALAARRLRADDFGGGGRDVVWVPTPDEVADAMLRLARVSARDVVCDLGAGDGRIPIMAARRFRARGLGVEIDPDLVASARRNAKAAGVADRVRIIEGDLFTADLSDATVITLYLMTHLNDKLQPRLLALRPGTRVVAHQFGMTDWEADDVAYINETRALLWVVPAQLAGSWSITGHPARAPMTLALHQRYQKLSGEAFIGTRSRPLLDARVHGQRFRFVVEDDRPWTFHGRVIRSGPDLALRGIATDGHAVHRFGATPVRGASVSEPARVAASDHARNRSEGR